MRRDTSFIPYCTTAIQAIITHTTTTTKAQAEADNCWYQWKPGVPEIKQKQNKQKNATCIRLFTYLNNDFLPI